ncbi:hypothetical protein [Streptomyces sp. NPDC059949]|uniref:hypothetical protein n=1 Tax=Streptomyces sp. NPDC059949 TaxID=3347013 RepID=UPI003647F71B
MPAESSRRSRRGTPAPSASWTASSTWPRARTPTRPGSGTRHATVFDHLLSEQAEQAVLAGLLTATWLQELEKPPETARAERLRNQGVDMARTWSEARGVDEQSRKDLLAEVESSALYGYREMKP